MTYAMSGIMANQFGGTPEGNAFLDQFGVQIKDKWLNVYIMIGYALLFRLAAHIVLKLVHHKR